MDVKHLALYLAKTVTDDNMVPSTTNAFTLQGQAPPSIKVLGGLFNFIQSILYLLSTYYMPSPQENKKVD